MSLVEDWGGLPDAGSSWDRKDIIDQLTPDRVEAFYRSLGVERFLAGGEGNWLVRSPLRVDRSGQSMTIRQSDGVWSDKATGDSGSIFDAAAQFHDVSFVESLEVVAEACGILPATMRTSSKKTTHYVYTTDDGEILYQVIRQDTGPGEKTFRVWHPEGDTWVKGLGDVGRVPYRLGDISQRQDEVIYLVEGEKCADAVAGIGLLATCVMGGSDGWRDEYAEWFRGRHVAIIPDHDEPGQKFAGKVGDGLIGVAASVKLVELPLGPVSRSKGLDVVDWLERGGDKDALVGYVDAAPVLSAGGVPDITEGIATLLSTDEPPPDQLIRLFWDVGGFGMIVAAPKSWKSFLALDMLLSVATGRPFLDHAEFDIPKAGPVLYWMEEGSRYDLRRRVLRWCAARGVDPASISEDQARFIFAKGLHVGSDDDLAQIREAVERHKPVLLVCDTMASVSWGMDENSTVDAGRIVAGLSQMRHVNGPGSCTVVYVHHANKAGGIRGSSAFFGALDNICTIERPDADDNYIHIKLNNRSGHLAEEFRAILVDDDGGDGVLQFAGAVGSTKPRKDDSVDTHIGREAVLEYLRKQPDGRSTVIEIAKGCRASRSRIEELVSWMTGDGTVVEQAFNREDGRRTVGVVLTMHGWGHDEVPF